MERMRQLLYGSATATDQASSSSSSGFAASMAAAAAAAAAAESEAAGDLGGRRAAAARQSLAVSVGISGRDLESHRLIEKRRRDRMNAALAELSRRIPAAMARQGLGRIEKAEIIEMAIQHIEALTSLLGDCKAETVGAQIPAICAENFQQGFLDCTRATLGYLAETEGPLSNTDAICTHLYASLHCAMQRFSTASSNKDPQSGSLLGNCREVRTQPVGSSSSDQASCRAHQTQRLRKPIDRQETATADADIGAFLSSAAAAAAAATAATSAAAVSTAETNSSMEKSPPLPSQKRICDNADQTEECRGVENTCSSSASEASSCEEGDGSDDDTHLPGFVLHPSGTHYLPLVLPRLALGGETRRNLLDDYEDDEDNEVVEGSGSARDRSRFASTNRQEVLHPISIPVSFRSARLLRVSRVSSRPLERSGGGGVTVGAKAAAISAAVKRKRPATTDSS